MKHTLKPPPGSRNQKNKSCAWREVCVGRCVSHGSTRHHQNSPRPWTRLGTRVATFVCLGNRHGLDFFCLGNRHGLHLFCLGNRHGQLFFPKRVSFLGCLTKAGSQPGCRPRNLSGGRKTGGPQPPPRQLGCVRAARRRRGDVKLGQPGFLGPMGASGSIF